MDGLLRFQLKHMLAPGWAEELQRQQGEDARGVVVGSGSRVRILYFAQE